MDPLAPLATHMLCRQPPRKFSAHATDPSPILYDEVPQILCTDLLLSHCIWSNVHWQLVYLLRNGFLYRFSLLAKSWNNEPMEQFTHSCWNISLHVEIGVGLQHIYTQAYLSANQNCKVWSCALKHEMRVEWRRARWLDRNLLKSRPSENAREVRRKSFIFYFWPSNINYWGTEQIRACYEHFRWTAHYWRSSNVPW